MPSFQNHLIRLKNDTVPLKKELLGIHLALKEFKYLILGYEIELYTDHKPLTPFFFNRLPQDAAMARWTIDMQPFNCTVKYFAGKKNIVADCLSRLRNEPKFVRYRK